MKTAVLDRHDWRLVLSLLLFALFFRLLTLMMIHTGVDERDYWFSAKRIVLGLPYNDIQHRTIRFSIIIPVAGIQWLLGMHPNVYYFAPVLLSLVQVLLLYFLGRTLAGKTVAFLGCLTLIMFPYMIRAGSQVRPEVFSITYVLLSILFFFRYLKSEPGDCKSLIACALLFFAAYLAKITNIYFLPGFLLAILIFRRSWKHAAIFGSILLALFAAETLIYRLLLGYRWGSLEIIARNHLASGYISTMPFWGIFARYRPRNFPFYWMIPALFFPAAAFFLHRRARDPRLDSLSLLTVSFFIGITFAVTGIHPAKPVEAFHHRYFMAVLPSLLLVDLVALKGMVLLALPGARRAVRVFMTPRTYSLLLAAAAVCLLAAAASEKLPSGIKDYLNNPLKPDSYPAVLNARYLDLINRAYQERIPIVSADTIGGSNALQTCTYYFLETRTFLHGEPPQIQKASVKEGSPESMRIGLIFNGPARPETISLLEKQEAEVLAAMRNPFHVWLTDSGSALRAIRSMELESQDDRKD